MTNGQIDIVAIQIRSHLTIQRNYKNQHHLFGNSEIKITKNNN